MGITTQYTSTPTNQCLVQGLCRLGAKHLYSHLLPYIMEGLHDPQLLEITDIDYEIYKTPEGTLHNNEVVEKAFEDQLNLKNVKKNNKVYSHKEQVIMLEEKKKELEKKKREGKLELTPKQKEIM